MYNTQQILGSRAILGDNHQQVPAASVRDKALAKMTSYLEGARERSAGTIQRILSETPKDVVVAANKLQFRPTDGGIAMGVSQMTAVHDNGLSQLAGRVGLPMQAVRHLQEVGQPWANQLLAHTLAEHTAHAVDTHGEVSRYLVRRDHTGQKVMAVLSDRFRRIDCRPGLDALIGTAQQHGALVTDAVLSDTRASVRVLIPQLFEISAGEFVLFGVSWRNSDYGRGAQDVAGFILRLWCLNGAVSESKLRQVHIGARLSEDFSYSKATLEADARASRLALQDITRGMLAPSSVRGMADMLTAAAAKTINPDDAIKAVAKKEGWSKGMTGQVADAFNRPDVEELPAGQTVWRLSNAISWVAKQETTSAEDRLDLERAAGSVLKS